MMKKIACFLLVSGALALAVSCQKDPSPDPDVAKVEGGKVSVLSLGINSQVESPYGDLYNVDLMQTYLGWSWVSQAGQYSFEHRFSKVK